MASRPHHYRILANATPHASRQPWVWMFLTFAIGCVGTLALAPTSARSPRLATDSALAPNPVEPLSFGALLALSDAELDKADIARVNLLCAESLPNDPGGSPSSILTQLNVWSTRVRSETDQYISRFQRNPAEYENSEPYFRMLILTTVIQQDFGVRYNPERVRQPDFRDSRDLFIHGLLSGSHTGTCISMPVLTVAIGRRLGYPLKLAQTKSHVYVRWELSGDRHLNFEATSRGLLMFDDAHYSTWPEPLTATELASGIFVRALSSKEELAVFLQARGHCLEDNGRLPEAIVAYAHAHALAPAMPYTLAFLADAMRKQSPTLRLTAATGSRPRPRSPQELLHIADQLNARNAARLSLPTPSILPIVPNGLFPNGGMP